MAQEPEVQEEPDEQEPEQEVEEQKQTEEVVEEEQGVSESEPPKESRANREIRVLRERAQSAEKAAKDAADEVAKFRQTQTDATRQSDEQRRDADEQRRIAAIEDPNARYQQELYYWARKRDADQQQRQALLEARLMDQSDKAAFEAKAAVNPKYAKYAAAVETELANARKNGTNASREQVLIYIVGKEALNSKSGATVVKQKQQAQARVAAARGSPNGARSDSGGGGRDKRVKDLEERLRDVPL